jgi:Icc-related predicted phosphoesterase
MQPDRRFEGRPRPEASPDRPARADTGTGRHIRVAAVGDLHVDASRRGSLTDVVAGVNAGADYLCLCGDLTYSGKYEQGLALVEGLKGVEIPIIAVLGNHDHEAGADDDMTRAMTDAGIHVLDGDGIVLQGVGFVGTKGFVGGFGRHSLAPFGETALKAFVQTAIDESLRLENALRNLDTPIKIALLHYAPIAATVMGEPEQIYPFLGSSRFLPPLEMHGTSVVFHGHAHHGSLEGMTPAGIPVFNVAYPLLRAHGMHVRIWTCDAPERRGTGTAATETHAAD